MYTDIAVIGGGASGLAAAIGAKTENPALSVTVFEKLDRVGKKLLSTGNGRCNLSSRSLVSEHYHGSVKNLMEIIKNTPSAEEFFMTMGVPVISDEQGRMYPRSESAAAVLRSLRMRTSELGITEVCGFELAEIRRSKRGYIITSKSGATAECRCIIAAAGGYAAPQLGTDGSVMRIFRDMGYKTAKICPAVAPLKVSPDKLKGLKGVRVKGAVSAISGGKILKTEQGEIQFTESALSGICVFNLARFFNEYEGRLALRLDLAADIEKAELIDYLERVSTQRAAYPLEELLTGFFPKNLAVYHVKNTFNRPLTEKISTLGKRDIIALADRIKSLEFEISGCSSWNNAQVTAGGIHGSCVDNELQSVRDRGIYFCGEILDADGDCGGYNLQWAWSSGLWAGSNCARSLKGAKR